MIWILATRGASTRLRQSPFAETAIAGVQGVVYRPGIAPVVNSGEDGSAGPAGTFVRGVHRISGVLFSYDGNVAETLFAITEPIDLIVRYTASGESRKRVLKDVLFIGDAVVTVPPLNRGEAELIGVPFRVQIPDTETLAQHVEDLPES
ncbi:MAG: hypothetical protein J5J06_12245 [Phycisphaerae bacterium]|nr:hypothetical protein [Phycisphaerae bacterium]